MKKKISLLSLLLVATKLLAFIMIIVGIAVIIVGGYEAYQLHLFCKAKLPVVPSVVTNRLVITIATNTPSTNPPPAGASRFAKFSTEKPSTFTVSYGIATYPTNTLWVSTEMKPTADGEVVIYKNDESHFVGSVSYGGYSFSWKVEGEDDPGTITTSTPEIVVIERTTNFVDWLPIFTNSLYGLDTAAVYTDNKAPQDRAFYRIKDDGKAPLPDWYLR